MIIRRDQMRAFEAAMKTAFEDRMVAHMARHYPRQYAAYTAGGDDDNGARDLVRRAVAKAAGIGAKTEGNIQQMLEIMLETSPDFDAEESMAWARGILNDDTLSGGTRIRLVHQKLPGHRASSGGAPARGR